MFVILFVDIFKPRTTKLHLHFSLLIFSQMNLIVIAVGKPIGKKLQQLDILCALLFSSKTAKFHKHLYLIHS